MGDCRHLEVDEEKGFVFVETNWWTYTGKMRCKHCGAYFHDETKKFLSNSIQAVIALLKK